MRACRIAGYQRVMRPLNMPDVWPVEVNATLVGGLLEGVASLLSSPHLTLQERNVGLNQPRPISKALCEAAATRQEAVLPAGNGVVAHAQVVTQAAAVADLVAVTALCDGLVSSQLLALARREPPSHHHGLSRHAVCSPFACQPHTSPFVCVALSSYRNFRSLYCHYQYLEHFYRLHRRRSYRSLLPAPVPVPVPVLL